MPKVIHLVIRNKKKSVSVVSGVFKIIKHHRKIHREKKKTKPLLLQQNEAENVPPRIQVVCISIITMPSWRNNVCLYYTVNAVALENMALPLTGELPHIYSVGFRKHIWMVKRRERFQEMLSHSCLVNDREFFNCSF